MKGNSLNSGNLGRFLFTTHEGKKFLFKNCKVSELFKNGQKKCPIFKSQNPSY